MRASSADFSQLLRRHLNGEDVTPKTVLDVVNQRNLGLDVSNIKRETYLPAADASKVRWKKKEASWPVGQYVSIAVEEELVKSLYNIDLSDYELLLSTPFTVGGLQ